MADVSCLPLAENRKRRAGFDSPGEGGCSSWFKRHRVGNTFARKLIDLRGFALSVRQAEEIARFIDLLPVEMEQEVSNILERCGDVDDAIRQLTSLKLNLEVPREVEAGAVTPTRDGLEADAGASHGPNGTPLAAVAAEAAARSDSEDAKSDAPVLTQEWVNAVVQEMSASSSIPDAQARATMVLQTFEGAVRGAVANKAASSKATVETLARENAILKRAVAIQNARQQDTAQLQGQVQELQKACGNLQQRLQEAERSNYSLSIHLREAMSNNSIPNRNPDVF